MENKPRLPKKGEYVKYQGLLIDVRKTQPPIPKPIIEYIFEERSAKKEIRFKNGTLLKELETLNDCYGLGTGEEAAIKELKAYCKKKGIDEDSDIEAFVVREIDHIIKKPENKPNFYDRTFLSFESISHGSLLKHKEIDVWCSKRGYLLKNDTKISTPVRRIW